MKYERDYDNKVVIEDTLYEGHDSLFGTAYKKDEDYNFYKGDKSFGKVSVWTLLGKILDESDTIDGTEPTKKERLYTIDGTELAKNERAYTINLYGLPHSIAKTK